jgi:hypothetical protein
MTVVIFPGDAFHSDVPRVTFFTRIRDFIHGIRSPESTRIPEGLVLGNWAKTLHPRNVGSVEFVDKFVSHLRRVMLYFTRRQHS